MVEMSDTAIQIDELRRQYGEDVMVLGHHYQRTAVVRHADAAGDSLELARAAAASRASRIVFCGVHFMAESADILSSPDQTVYLPEISAGCPMADMADAESMQRAWDELTALSSDWVPIVYVNSTAAVKAICGRHGGSSCTSSNAARIFEWAFGQGKRILFLPDEHLGANTAHDLGLPDAQVAVYDPRLPLGGLTEQQMADSRVVVWKGFCLVHQAMTVADVEAMRAHVPEATIIVHPECPKEVVRACDAHGSTKQIIDYVDQAPDGSTIIVGTELNLVERLAERHAGRLVVKALRPSVCANMSKISANSLLRTLEAWPVSNQIHVDPAVAADARLSLERMLSI
jgi:quinolinate synthase